MDNGFPRQRVDLARVGRSAMGGNPYTNMCSYSRYRPDYSTNAVLDALMPYRFGSDWVAQANLSPRFTAFDGSALRLKALKHIWGGDFPLVLDVGAGTGKYTGALRKCGITPIAVEPAETMVARFRKELPDVPLYQLTAEKIGEIGKRFQLITYSQCWHWVDSIVAGEVARECLKPGGQIAIVFNQMNVSFPWVKRLSRVMRSGDVHFPDRPPKIGPGWSEPLLRIQQWEQRLHLTELYELGKTRSSYLKATEAGKKHLEENTKHYLETELGLAKNAILTLPYYTLTWIYMPV